MSKRTRVDGYLADREKGMTYRQIGEKYGVSAQAVQICCARQGEMPRKALSARACIWPNLRIWLNADRARAERFFQEMQGCTIRMILKGGQQPKKDVIDRMLKLTGMSYEEMFAQEEI